jgi:hypothetical protein
MTETRKNITGPTWTLEDRGYFSWNGWKIVDDDHGRPVVVPPSEAPAPQVDPEFAARRAAARQAREDRR